MWASGGRERAVFAENRALAFCAVRGANQSNGERSEMAMSPYRTYVGRAAHCLGSIGHDSPMYLEWIPANRPTAPAPYMRIVNSKLRLKLRTSTFAEPRNTTEPSTTTPFP